MKHADLRGAPSEKAVLQHWHIIQMAGHQHELHHSHLVLVEDPSHIHPVTAKSSYGRFLAKHLDGARQAVRA